MFDVGWSELLVIGALALIVVGPRELPQLLRTVGQFVGKVKRMGREFQRSLEDAARDSNVADFKDLRDLRKDLGSLNFRDQASRAQSYMNQPVKPAKTDAGSGVAPEAKPAPDEPAIGKPAAQEAPEPEAATEAPAAPEPRQPEPRQAAKG